MTVMLQLSCYWYNLQGETLHIDSTFDLTDSLESWGEPSDPLSSGEGTSDSFYMSGEHAIREDPPATSSCGKETHPTITQAIQQQFGYPSKWWMPVLCPFLPFISWQHSSLPRSLLQPTCQFISPLPLLFQCSDHPTLPPFLLLQCPWHPLL